MQATILSGVSWCLMTVVIAAVLYHRRVLAQSQECTHRYTTQPPRTADIDCNPYGNDATTLVLQCTVIIPEEDIVGSSIQWFHGDEVIQTDSVNQVSQSSRLTLSRLEESDMGKYYCLLVSGSIPREPSDSLNLPSVDDLMPFNPCNPEDVYFREETKCATALPTPETTQSTSVILTSSFRESTSAEVIVTTPPFAQQTTSSSLYPSPTSFPTNPVTASDTIEPPSSSGTLQVWIYVLVAVAAVFAMIIIVLAIMCVGLCLKRSKTIDTNSLKQNGHSEQFTPKSDTMVTNEMYNRGEDVKFTTGTHHTSHSQIADYSTLGERDYETIDVFDSKQDYHHLQRPSPPSIPNGRTTVGLSPIKEFQSMSTLTSQLGNGDIAMSRGGGKSFSTMPLPPPPNEPPHIYRELEVTPSIGSAIYRSPTNSSPPDSARLFERGDSRAQLLPNGGPPVSAHLKCTPFPMNSNVHEALYSDNFSTASNPVFVQALQDIPETGPVFADPPNPTAFPVNEYDFIPASKYETPVSSKRRPGDNPKSRASVKSLNYETDPKVDLSADITDMTDDSSTVDFTRNSFIDFKVSDVPTDNATTGDHSTDITGTAAFPLPVNVYSTMSSDDLTGGSSLEDYLSRQGTMVSLDITKETSLRSEKSRNTTLSEEAQLQYPHLQYSLPRMSHPRAYQGQLVSHGRRSDSANNFSTFDQRTVAQSEGKGTRASSVPPLSQSHHYKRLDPTSMEYRMKYAQLHTGLKTTV